MATTRGIDSGEAWRIAIVSLIILSISFGSPYITTVALKTIAAELGGERSIPSGANALAWLGTGVGGLMMGLIAERIGIRATVIVGALSVALGLVLSSGGTAWQLYVGHGLFIGLIGNGAINAPLYVYVSRWFETRRGTAIALIASGQYAAGAFWPPLFERAIAMWGWRQTMVGFGIVVASLAIPLALAVLKPPPAPPTDGAPSTTTLNASGRPRSHGLHPNLLFALLAIASFLCCIPMAMPSAHLIAFCGDLGMAPAKGAAMLSLLLICAFFSRQFWGWLSDRIGGLYTLVICSTAQAAAVSGFLLTQDEAGLFAIAAAFGLGFRSSPRARPLGVSPRCCSLAPPAWRRAAGLAVSSTISSDHTRRPSRQASPPTSSTSQSLSHWSSSGVVRSRRRRRCASRHRGSLRAHLPLGVNAPCFLHGRPSHF
jgi:MFS family permease